MALTPTVDNDEFHGFKFGSLDLGAYATGGVAVTGADVACPETLVQLIVHSASGYVAWYNPATGKVLVYEQTDPAAVGGANVALVEVGNGVSLAGIAFPFTAFGY